jgi:gluconolactonase
MKRRLLPLSLIIASTIVYACSDSSDEPPTTPIDTPETGSTTPDTSTNDPDTSTAADTSTADTSVPPSGDPLAGIGAVTSIAAFNDIYTEGPQWRGDSLYFAEAKPNGHLLKFNPALAASLTNPVEVRSVVTAGSIPLGTTFDEKGNTFITCEVPEGAGGGQLVRTPATGAAGSVGTPIVLTTDAGVAPAFDSPNDIVARKTDGTLYLTDPGYQNPGTAANHLWRVKPTTGEVFETVTDSRPNGIALSPDEKTLYVSFTDAPSKVMKYPVAADGAIGAGAAFTTIMPGDALADGLAVDANGNVYVAVKNGVDVFKPDGGKWGHIATTKIVNGLAFGGADKKTLFMTSDKGLLQVTLKTAGLLQ